MGPSCDAVESPFVRAAARLFFLARFVSSVDLRRAFLHALVVSGIASSCRVVPWFNASLPQYVQGAYTTIIELCNSVMQGKPYCRQADMHLCGSPLLYKSIEAFICILCLAMQTL